MCTCVRLVQADWIVHITACMYMSRDVNVVKLGNKFNSKMYQNIWSMIHKSYDDGNGKILKFPGQNRVHRVWLGDQTGHWWNSCRQNLLSNAQFRLSGKHYFFIFFFFSIFFLLFFVSKCMTEVECTTKSSQWRPWRPTPYADACKCPKSYL